MAMKVQPTVHLRQFIKPKVAAARLGVCTKTVMRMADAGAIPVANFNHRQTDLTASCHSSKACTRESAYASMRASLALSRR